MLNIAHACQTCHPFPEEELKGRVEAIQSRNYALLDRSGKAAVEFLDAMKTVRQPFDDAQRPAAEEEARASSPKTRPSPNSPTPTKPKN